MSAQVMNTSLHLGAAGVASRASAMQRGSAAVRVPSRVASRTSSRGVSLRVRAEGEGPSDKNLEVMRKFSEQYARGSGTYFCMDKSVTAVVIQGLAEHKDTLGAPLCPCRHYDDKEAEVESGFWNCPCVPMRERKECHCMLFLTEVSLKLERNTRRSRERPCAEDNDFVGDEQKITIDEIKELAEGI